MAHLPCLFTASRHETLRAGLYDDAIRMIDDTDSCLGKIADLVRQGDYDSLRAASNEVNGLLRYMRVGSGGAAWLPEELDKGAKVDPRYAHVERVIRQECDYVLKRRKVN